MGQLVQLGTTWFWLLLLRCSAEEIKRYQEFPQHSLLTPSALLRSASERRGMGSTWILHTLCLCRKQKQPPPFLQHKEFTPRKKGGFFIHLCPPQNVARSSFGHHQTWQNHNYFKVSGEASNSQIISYIGEADCSFAFLIVLSSSASQPWEPRQQAAPLSFSSG